MSRSAVKFSARRISKKKKKAVTCDIDPFLSVLFLRGCSDIRHGQAQARGVGRKKGQRPRRKVLDSLFARRGLGDRLQRGERAERDQLGLRLRGAVGAVDEADGQVGAGVAVGGGVGASLEPGSPAGEGRRRVWRREGGREGGGRGGRGREGRRRRRGICDGPCIGQSLFFFFVLSGSASRLFLLP